MNERPRSLQRQAVRSQLERTNEWVTCRRRAAGIYRRSPPDLNYCNTLMVNRMKDRLKGSFGKSGGLPLHLPKDPKNEKKSRRQKKKNSRVVGVCFTYLNIISCKTEYSAALVWLYCISLLYIY